ncbi:MAG: bifunctional prephenate dehydrogenase/3-phosphoshikimate 1-carboxyvinyltransferase, partial [Armatimonadetes bacterium]|nr:bifunctional prephenate dehydrogenase/3-phosphoshikimate 1-carboxyvinyltransferase [Armatimonadota bacterium]
MNLIVSPVKRISGELHVPGDKSISHRAAMIASLAEGETHIRGFLTAEDCLNTLEVLRELGVPVVRGFSHVAISGKGLGGYLPPSGPLFVGNSGTTFRLMMGLVAPQPFDVTLDGDESIRKRPMDRVAKPLSLMGAQV